MKYKNIWDAVDKLAEVNGLSPSGLAKKAGLDSTTFNKSKRVRTDGKNRFPSLDSIYKITSACNVSFDDFMAMTENEVKIEPSNSIAYIKYSNGKSVALTGNALMQFPESKNDIYAMQIDSKTTIYEENSIIIISKNSDIRTGDRIAIFTNDKKIHLGKFIRKTQKEIEIFGLNINDEQINIDIKKIMKIDRILWASQ